MQTVISLGKAGLFERQGRRAALSGRRGAVSLPTKVKNPRENPLLAPTRFFS